ncbi:unnamed protein product [Rhodiola kirilowii]
MAAGSMESFYRQKKRGGISKSKAKALISSKKKASSASHASALGFELRDVHEDAIRQFDLNMRYGPCIGMSRLDRWERAKKLGMNPPQDIESHLKSSIIGADCVFEGRL